MSDSVIRISPQNHERLTRIAKASGLSHSEVLHLALNAYERKLAAKLDLGHGRT